MNSVEYVNLSVYSFQNPFRGNTNILLNREVFKHHSIRVEMVQFKVHGTRFPFK